MADSTPPDRRRRSLHAFRARGPLTQRVVTGLQFALLPSKPGDQYIASFPRSGSTWLRTVVTNVLVPDAASNPSVVNARIPGVSLRNLPAIYRLPTPRLLKTHRGWWPGVPRAVYVVRDGEDAVTSLYHYVTSRVGREMSVEAFHQAHARGEYGEPWAAHVEGWLGRGRASMGDDLLVVPFEDLKADTVAVVGSVLSFLGIEAGADRVQAATEAASVENMRKIEARRRGGVDTANASFYRGGRSGQTSPVFPPERRAAFRRDAARALALAGYAGAPDG